MPNRLTACLPQCLRPMDADDEPARATDRSGTVPARGTAAGARCSIEVLADAGPPMTRLERMVEIHQRLEEMERWPKSPLLQSLIRRGRTLLCEGHRADPPTAEMRATHQAWQRDVEALDEVWQAMPTTRQRSIELLEAAVPRQRTAARQALLNEQLIPARQQVDLAREAFGQRQLDRAQAAEAKAAERLQLAGSLITWMEHATDEEIQSFSRQCQGDRAAGSTAQMRAFLDRVRRPGDEARLRQHLGSTGRESVLSASSRHSDAPAAWPAESMLKHSLVKALRELRVSADALPQAGLLCNSVKALCSALKAEVETGPRLVSTQHRELYASLKQRIAWVREMQLQVSVSALEGNQVREAACGLPAAQRYRLKEVERLHNEMKAAFGSEDYAKVCELGQHGLSLRRATLALAQNPTADPQMLTDIAERRCQLAEQLKPWSDLRALNGPALLYASQAHTILRLLDESTHTQHCQHLLYEVEAVCRQLTALGHARGGPRTFQGSAQTGRGQSAGLTSVHDTSQGSSGSSGSSSGRSVRSLAMLQSLGSMEDLDLEADFHPAMA